MSQILAMYVVGTSSTSRVDYIVWRPRGVFLPPSTHHVFKGCRSRVFFFLADVGLSPSIAPPLPPRCAPPLHRALLRFPSRSLTPGKVFDIRGLEALKGGYT